MKSWVILLFLFKTIASNNALVQPANTTRNNTSNTLPIVLWHGMGDTCCYSFSLGSFVNFLKEQIPGVHVISLRIGDNLVEDFEAAYFMSPNRQIDYVCDILQHEPKLQNGFNAIGFSQGSQFLRAAVQKCGHKIPPVRNLISLGGQHQGVYGIPNCAALQHKTCDYIRKLLNYAAYAKWVQDSLVQATYWHDPLDEKSYKAKSIFLADINNERQKNETYIKNLNNLENFVLVKFNNDSIVQPRETEWFGYYVPGQDKEMQTLKETELYIKDRIGLKRMDEQGKLKFLASPGDHLQFVQEWFIQKIIKPYLL